MIQKCMILFFDFHFYVPKLQCGDWFPCNWYVACVVHCNVICVTMLFITMLTEMMVDI